MNKVFKQLSSFLLPITVIIVIPHLLEKDISISIFNKSGLLGSSAFYFELLLIIIGLLLLFTTIRTFILIGKGTLAPWSPTSKLIVGGIYAHIRNPMISGVLIVLLGESLIFISYKLFIWFILFFIINNIYFSISEEPGLLKRFGEEYQEYKNNVPRWIPRIKPWKPSIID